MFDPGVAYLKVGVHALIKFWVYPLLGVQNPQFDPQIWGTYATVKATYYTHWKVL